MEERYNRHSTIITTNPGYDEWHNFPGKQADGGCAAQPRAALLSHGDHQRAVVARSAGIRFIKRRLTRHAHTPQLEVIGSPAYFSPVTEEVLQRKLSPEEQAALEQIRAKFRRVESEPKSPFGHVKF